MGKTKKTTTPPRFEAGARVRVRRGVVDPDFSAIPLGGWAVTVKEVAEAQGPTVYLVQDEVEKLNLGEEAAFVHFFYNGT